MNRQTDLLRIKEVVKRTGVSRSHTYALMEQGRFPQSVKLTERAVAWRADDIARWVQERLAGTPA